MPNDIDFINSEKEREQGNIYFKEGDYELAIFHYTRAIHCYRENYVLFNNRSLAYYKNGEYEKSLNDALRSLELENDNLKGLYRVTEVYKILKDNENYLKYLELYNKKRGIDTNEIENLKKEFLKKENENKKKEKENSIKKSDELLNLENIENKNIFLFHDLNNLNETNKDLKETNKMKKKEQYKNNFLIEEVYNFKDSKK